MTSKLQYVGWQVGITYQTRKKAGLDRHYLHDLLSEMRDQGMNFISFMMISHGLNDALHDGYAWPVANPKLKCYTDRHCLNSNPETEFLSGIIEEAGNLGFHVNLFMNGFWWNHNRVKVGYPDIRTMGEPTTPEALYSHCADNDDTWRLACDEVSDLLAYYSRVPVSSYGFELIGRGGCHCPDTMKLFKNALASAGLDPDQNRNPHAAEDLWRRWNGLRDKQVLEEFVRAIRHAAPALGIWHHGYMELGDFGGYRFSADSCRKAGVDMAMPCVHTLMSEDMLEKVLASADGFPVALHVDTREGATLNYDVPAKNPEYLRNIGRWILEHNRHCLKGVVFFNEPFTSQENKKAVFVAVKTWRDKGVF